MALVRLEFEPPLAALTLARPARHNSLVPELLRDLLAALAAVRARPEARALILQAEGRSFSTGGDLRGFQDHQADLAGYAHELVGLLNEAILALADLPIPSVAAVHGQVTGGALGLVLAADLVLVAPAGTFTPYYATVGFSPDGGWTAMLPAVIGPRRAAAALLLDQAITAEHAVAWGLAERCVPAADLAAEARAAARRLAGLAPGSLRRARLLLRGAGLAERLEAERAQFLAQLATPEARRGLQRFLEARPA
ncbi:MAG: enoyl-CoA hydratase/isomerase family protein [Anaerolineales bacterium]|nr:enoyl-CoA hydratase/isomerase family protein [Anaerolineales bacterium]